MPHLSAVIYWICVKLFGISLVEHIVDTQVREEGLES